MLDEREQQLAADQRHLDDLYAQIVTLQTSMLEQEADNQAAGAEVARDRQALQEKQAESYAKMAFLFEGTKAKDAAQLLTTNYGPDEAARILGHLDDDRVREIMSQIHVLLGDDGPRYMQALQASDRPSQR